MIQKLRDLNNIVKQNKTWSQDHKQMFCDIMQEFNSVGLDSLDNVIQEIINFPTSKPVIIIFQKMDLNIQRQFVEKFLEMNDKNLDSYLYISKLCKLYQITIQKGYIEQNNAIFLKILQRVGQKQQKDRQIVNQLKNFFYKNIDNILVTLKGNRDSIPNLDDIYQYMLELCLNKTRSYTLNKLKIYNYFLENGSILERVHKKNILNLVDSMSQDEMKKHATLLLGIQKVLDKESKEIIFKDGECTEKYSQIDENNMENPIDILDGLSKDILLLKSIYSKQLGIQKVLDKESKEIIFKDGECTEKYCQIDENNMENPIDILDKLSKDTLLLKSIYFKQLGIRKVLDKQNKEVVSQEDNRKENQSEIVSQDDENNLENPINLFDKLSEDILLLKSVYLKQYKELEQYKNMFQEKENELKVCQEKAESLKKVVTSKEQQINKLLLNEDDYKSKIEYLNREKINLLEKNESLVNELEKLNLMGEADIKSAEEQLKNKIRFKLSTGYKNFNIIKTREMNESSYKALIKIFERNYSDLKELGINLGE